MKSAIFFLLFIAVTQAAFFPHSFKDEDPVEETQQIFNGLWAFGNLTEPKDLAQTCFGTNTSQLFIDFLKEFLEDLADNQPYKAFKASEAFFEAAPPEVHDCMNDSPYTKELYQAYGITGTVDQIFGRCMVYILSHLKKVQQEAVNANVDIQTGKYFQVGQDWGQFTLDVFKPSALVL